MAVLIIGFGIAVCVYVFFCIYPSFGGKTPVSRKRQSSNFVNGKFVNQIPTPMDMGLASVLSILRDQLKGVPNWRPTRPLVPEHLDVSKTLKAEQAQITWFGHSAFLL